MIDDINKGRVELVNREKLCVDGVLGILTFDDSYILLNTSMGDMYIDGESLVVDDLSKETQKISITGKVISLGFSDKRIKKGKKGIF